MPTYPEYAPSIERILTRNHEWADGLRRLNPATLDHLASNGQTPEVLWIGCADSRVPESVITASMPGDIFVHRNIANQFAADDRSATAAVQFAVENLHVSYIFVVGHTRCGGVAAALRAASPGNHPNAVLGGWLTNLAKLAQEHDLVYPEPADEQKLAENMAKLTKLNITDAMERVRSFVEGWRVGSDENRAAAETKALTIVGLVYNLDTGILEEVGQRLQVRALQRKVTRGFEECSEEISIAGCTC